MSIVLFVLLDNDIFIFSFYLYTILIVSYNQDIHILFSKLNVIFALDATRNSKLDIVLFFKVKYSVGTKVHNLKF